MFRKIEKYWYNNGPVAFFLVPLTWLYCGISLLRKYYLKRKQPPLSGEIPVIVVGNITVGGTGKTPMVIWMVDYLRAQGYKPGVVSRGYGGSHANTPIHVTRNSDVREVGDEALVIVRRAQCPMWVCRDRISAMEKMVEESEIDLIISDDGLQHYKMPRHIEIAMIDGARRFGNGLCLPAGPLREPVSRLKDVDFRVVTGSLADEDEIAMELVGDTLVNIRRPVKVEPLTHFQGQQVHAVAALGNPARFFYQLELAGLELIRHRFPDHHVYRLEDLQFDDELPIIMTEKDAVKCSMFADMRFWFLPIKGRLDNTFPDQLLAKIKDINRG